jgi:UDP-2,3-diacylglucosamine pyrophosphatase LpxH
MLVFLSDIHLTDGTCGNTINPGAFEKFSEQLFIMAKKASAKDVEVVFLGDIFDIIRSSYWTNNKNIASDGKNIGIVRPWNIDGEKDIEGNGLDEYSTRIMRKICSNQKNDEIHNILEQLKQKFLLVGINIRFSYLIGNHDWLVNKTLMCRKMAENFLLLDKDCSSIVFKDNMIDFEHGVIARHGDIYDQFNYEGDRKKSSLGDAIVIDLLNSFPFRVWDELSDAPSKLINDLCEIDNVRPMSNIPDWILGVCNPYGKKILNNVKDIWNDLAKKFLRIPFVSDHDRFLRWDAVDALQIGLGISTVLPLQVINRISLEKIIKSSDEYYKNAITESELLREGISHVVYGHTHYPVIEPLNVINNKNLMYFNTGTWRRVHTKTKFDEDKNKFVTWDVMTFVVLYKESERKTHSFEVWNGSLSVN